MALRAVGSHVMRLWELLQVELHGQYSVERLHLVHQYSRTHCLWRVLLIVTITPLPSLLLISMLDLMPLEPISAGFDHSYIFRTRAALGAWCMAYGALEQYRQLIPKLKTSFIQLLAMSLFTALGTAFGMQLVAKHLGHPIPFLVICVTPIYMVCLSLAIVIAWGRQLKHDKEVKKELQQYQVVVGILFLLTLIYPAYISLFASLDSTGQTCFSLLLPVIKLLAKNAISPFCKYIEDFKPEAVIFNVEIFHALFVAICMQSATSIKTTLLLMLLDFVHAVLSTRDIHMVVCRLVEIRIGILAATQKTFADARQVTRKTMSTDIGQVMDHVLFLVKYMPSLQHNRCIRIGSRAAAMSSRENRWAQHVRGFNSVAPETQVKVKPQQFKSMRRPSHTRSRRGTNTFDLSAVPDTLPSEVQEVLTTVLTDDERAEYVELTLQLLHIIEFVILIEYTEVIIPFVYALYLLVIVNLPNLQYYPMLSGYTPSTIFSAIGNIGVYALLEFVSFVLLDFYLLRKLQFSGLWQLAFVLEKQWKLVQLKLCVWLLFMIQISLVHYGMDFSFQFNWSKAGNMTAFCSFWFI